MEKSQQELNHGLRIYSQQAMDNKTKEQVAPIVKVLDSREIGKFVFIKFNTSGGNTVSIQITTHQLAQWLAESIPSQPGIGVRLEQTDYPDFTAITNI